MNSRQRRRQRRKFGHTVCANDVDPRTSTILYDMIYWCDSRYGHRGYLYEWRDGGPTFRFAKSERALEFRLVWS